MVAFRLDSARTTPTEDPVAALVFALGGSRASAVMVGGRHLMEGGETVINPGGLRARVSNCGRSLATWRSTGTTPGVPGR